MRGKPLSEETKHAVIGALLAGISVTEAARKYQLPQSTVSRIKSEIPVKLDDVGLETREELDDIIVQHLRINLVGMNRIARQTEREKWIDKQSASGLAELYAQMSNHSLQLLEAASAVENKPEGE